jgi:hypothetical protein
VLDLVGGCGGFEPALSQFCPKKQVNSLSEKKDVATAQPWWHDVRKDVVVALIVAAALAIASWLGGFVPAILDAITEVGMFLYEPIRVPFAKPIGAVLAVWLFWLFIRRLKLRRNQRASESTMSVQTRAKSTQPTSEDKIEKWKPVFEALDDQERSVLRIFIDHGRRSLSQTEFVKIAGKLGAQGELLAAAQRLSDRGYISIIGSFDKDYVLDAAQFKVLSQFPSLVGSSAPKRYVLV